MSDHDGLSSWWAKMMIFGRHPLLVVVVLASCGEGVSTDLENRQVAEVLVLSGNAQVGPAGVTLETPLVVELVGSDGEPVGGVDVTWEAAGGTVNPASSSSGTDGRASTRWTLATHVGEQVATVHVPGLTKVSFEATATLPEDTRVTIEAAPSEGFAGALSPNPLKVRFTLPDGAGLQGVTPDWSGDGWTFPIASTSDETGAAEAWWVPGGDPVQTVMVGISGSISISPATAQVMVDERAARANSIYLDSRGLAPASGFRTDLVPIHDFPSTFYAALVWDGAYAGLQRTGDLFDRQVHFSVWDAEGVDAVVVDAFASTCSPFGGEGTGQKCRFSYPWVVGGTYRFEMTAASNGGSTDYTVRFRDLDGDYEQAVATIRYGASADLTWVTSFVEDFGPFSDSCLATSERSARINKRELQRGGVWESIGSARFSVVDDLSVCANVSVSADMNGITYGTGGDGVGHPGQRDALLDFPGG